MTITTGTRLSDAGLAAKVPRPSEAQTVGRRYALLVGVSSVIRRGAPRLNFVDNDIEQLERLDGRYRRRPAGGLAENSGGRPSSGSSLQATPLPHNTSSMRSEMTTRAFATRRLRFSGAKAAPGSTPWLVRSIRQPPRCVST